MYKVFYSKLNLKLWGSKLMMYLRGSFSKTELRTLDLLNPQKRLNLQQTLSSFHDRDKGGKQRPSYISLGLLFLSYIYMSAKYLYKRNSGFSEQRKENKRQKFFLFWLFNIKSTIKLSDDTILLQALNFSNV